MTSRLSLLGCTLLIVFWPVAPRVAAQAALNVKNTLKDARTAQDQGRFADALAKYVQVLESKEKDAGRYRPDALYGAAVAGLAGGLQAEGAKTRARLEELTTKWAAFGHRPEILMARRLLDETERQATERAALTAQRDTAAREKNACVAESAAAGKQLATALSELKAERGRNDVDPLRAANQQLREELARTKSELEKTAAELDRKDRALKKVTGALMTPKH